MTKGDEKNKKTTSYADRISKIKKEHPIISANNWWANIQKSIKQK